MSNLVRFGVSIEKDLLENFDILLDEKNYATRSEAIRDLIRDTLGQQRIDNSNTNVLGSLTANLRPPRYQIIAANVCNSTSASRVNNISNAPTR